MPHLDDDSVFANDTLLGDDFPILNSQDVCEILFLRHCLSLLVGRLFSNNYSNTGKAMSQSLPTQIGKEPININAAKILPQEEEGIKEDEE